MKLRILPFWPLAVISCVVWWAFGNRHIAPTSYELGVTAATKEMREVPKAEWEDISQQENCDETSDHSEPVVLVSVGEQSVIRDLAESEIPIAINIKMFGKHHPFEIGELPDGNLKGQLEKISPEARQKAMKELHNITFGELDAAEHLRVHKNGDIYIVCPDGHGNCKGHAKKSKSPDSSALIAEHIPTAPAQSDTAPAVEYAPIPVSAPPVYNSRPGATHHIYIDFNGGVVSGKNWSETDTKGTADTSDDVTWTSWDCYPFDMDGNTTTFSDAEQTAMRQIWERVAEDYAPFDVNVTTDITYDSENYTGDKNKVGWLMMTAIVDKNGAYCPHRGAGGVADLGSFGTSVYFRDKQPAWVNTTGGSTLDVAGVAEAASHEMGHNMGLSHDGTSSSAYYGGHLATSSAPSWGPLMGTGYVRNVSQWSKGQYYGANQLQDDLAIISSKIPYRVDDHGDSFVSATVWTNSSVYQKGIVERTDNPDCFAFTTAAGTITFNAAAYKCDGSTWGANLDITLELYNSAQVLVASSNPLTDVNAAISYTASAGDYYVVLKPSAAGNPMVADRSGYTSYGSLGQYTITGSFVPADGLMLTSPNGGERWTRGTSNEITWSSGLGGNVKIELLKNGVLNATLASSTSNNGTYSWPIPANQPIGSNYRIRITSIDQPAKTDTSLADFTIGAPPAYYASMDTNPGWSLDTGWEYGTPTGVNQDGFGNPDPTSGYNGSKVIGYKLSGDYEASITTTRWAKTPVINCSNYSSVKLSFYRWLGVEAGFDNAYIQVSNNGTNWTQVWRSPTAASGGNVEDYVWTYCEYDISAVADGKSTVYVRWGMGTSDVEWQWCGWNLDEVRVDGNFLVQTPTISTWPTASTINEGQNLSASTLSGGSASVAGSFSFDNPVAVPAVGTASHGVTFTPTDTVNYNTVSGNVNVTVRSAFDAWASGGSGITFDGDANGDGLADGLAWLFGAATPSSNSRSLLPGSAVNSGALILNFQVRNPANRGTAVMQLQYSKDLGVGDPWANHTLTIPDTSTTVNGVAFVITPNGGLNQVQATIPENTAEGAGKIFVRLKGQAGSP